MAQASHKGMGVKGGTEHVGASDPDTAFDVDNMASEMQGRNSLHGMDQERARNQRITQAGETQDTEGVVESFEKEEAREDASKKS